MANARVRAGSRERERDLGESATLTVPWSPQHVDTVSNVRYHAIEGLVRSRGQADDAVPIGDVGLGTPVPPGHHRAEAKLLVTQHLAHAVCDTVTIRIRRTSVDHLLTLAVELSQGAHASEGVVQAGVRLGRRRYFRAIAPRRPDQPEQTPLITAGL